MDTLSDLRSLCTPSDNPVVIYDSGVGGLTVARHLIRLRPGTPLVYVADNEWFPYGNRTDGDLRARIHAVLRTICDVFDPQAVVIACNTASTLAGDGLDVTVGEVRVFKTVPPIAEAIALVPDDPLALLATPATLRCCRTLLGQGGRSGQIVGVPAMPLVHLAEKRLSGVRVTAAMCESAMSGVLGAAARWARGVILGCTHFPWLLDELRTVFPVAQVWADPALAVARRVANVIGPDRTEGPPGRRLALTSGQNGPALRRVFMSHGFGSSPCLLPVYPQLLLRAG